MRGKGGAASKAKVILGMPFERKKGDRPLFENLAGKFGKRGFIVERERPAKTAYDYEDIRLQISTRRLAGGEVWRESGPRGCSTIKKKSCPARSSGENGIYEDAGGPTGP